MQNAIKQNAQTLSNVADVYDLSTDTDKELCWQIYRDMGGGDGTKGMPLPQVAKFVDGKFVQLVPLGLAEDTVANMIKIAKTSAATFNDDVKNSKGTTYVMITSADGCQYCNYLHNQLKTMLSDVEESFGFYELATNQGADRDLCWQIYRDLGGGDGTQAMPLPQIAKFVDGEFGELISNTRDFGTPGKNNATIKEMFEKAVGNPVNNITSNMSEEESQETQNTQSKEKTTGKEYINQTLIKNIQLMQNQLNAISVAKQIKEEEYDKLQKELEEKQEEYENIMSKIQDNEDEELYYQTELSSLGDAINSLQSTMNTLEIEINSLNSQYKAKALLTKTLNS